MVERRKQTCDQKLGRKADNYIWVMPSRQYLIVFAQAHEDFRVPELRSIAELHGFPLSISDDFDSARPFGILSLEQEEHARFLARRCILIKYV